MAYDLKFEGYVKGVGNVYRVNAPFDKEMKLFDEHGLKIISAKQLAVARMQHGAQSSFSENESWIKEGVLYLPESLAGKTAIILLKDSLTLDNPEAAFNAHRRGKHERGKEYLIDNDEAMEILEKAQKGNKGYLLLQSTARIPTYDRFGEEAIPVFLFGKNANDYGLFLGENYIKTMFSDFNIDEHINEQSGAYANQLLLHGLYESSIIDGDWDFSLYTKTCGVQSVARGGRAEKTRSFLEERVKKALDAGKAFRYKGRVWHYD